MMDGLRDLVRDYLKIRRALGYKLREPERRLNDFCRYLEETGQTAITTENIVAWAVLPGGTADWHSKRIGPIRVFARWAHAFDPSIEVPARDILPGHPHRSVPFIYSTEQLQALMGRAGSLPNPMIAASYRTLIGLLACTGMRVGEALSLNRTDLNDGVLHVVNGKGGGSRLLPLHPSVADALADYSRTRDRRLGEVSTDAFFVSTHRTRVIYNCFQWTFQRLVAEAGIRPRSSECRARIHDLRHTFAVRTMLDAYQDGRNPAEVLPVLATYLGHANPRGTYWYLEADPNLLIAAMRRVGPLEPDTSGPLS